MAKVRGKNQPPAVGGRGHHVAGWLRIIGDSGPERNCARAVLCIDGKSHKNEFFSAPAKGRAVLLEETAVGV